MREILFRGKRTDNGEWVDGFLLKECSYATCSWPLAIEYKTGCFGVNEYAVVEVIPETVGQFTGLCDKYGAKIYEGDILQFDYIGESKGVHGKAAVCFENGKFGVLWGWHKEFVTLDGFANTTLEVIGNIHDIVKN